MKKNFPLEINVDEKIQELTLKRHQNGEIIGEMLLKLNDALLSEDQKLCRSFYEDIKSLCQKNIDLVGLEFHYFKKKMSSEPNRHSILTESRKAYALASAGIRSELLKIKQVIQATFKIKMQDKSKWLRLPRRKNSKQM